MYQRVLYALCLPKTKKYNQYKISLHKLSNLDGILLLKNIAQISDNIYSIIKNDKMIEIKMKYAKPRAPPLRAPQKNDNNKYPYTLYFKEYLLLPASIRALDIRLRG